jgi:methionine-rich copper-binding protein CopC
MVVARTFGAVLLLVLLSGAPAAYAHAFLERAAPPVGSSLPAAPHALSLRFTEAVEPHFSTIAVNDAQGTPIKIGAVEAGDDGRSLVVALPPLGSGTYTVVWHATSVDTHKTEGRYDFTVER